MHHKKIIFVHGYTANPNINFYPAISKKLDKLGVEYSIPALPGHKNPHSKDWLEIIDREVKTSEKPVVLVGHSLGTRAVLLYLDEFHHPIDSILLISSFNDDLSNGKRRDEHYADFFEHNLDLEKIKTLANRFVVIHSRDDSALPYSQGEEMARKLGAKLITFENKDHFCKPEDAEEINRVLINYLLGQ